MFQSTGIGTLSHFLVKIPKNIYTRGEVIAIDFVLDNKGSIEVDALRVSLDQMDTTTTANVGAKKIVKTHVSKVNCEWYKEVSRNILRYSFQRETNFLVGEETSKEP